ncbi:hypothetical protein COOONC_04874 [Cooperia oncophora]
MLSALAADVGLEGQQPPGASESLTPSEIKAQEPSPGGTPEAEPAPPPPPPPAPDPPPPPPFQEPPPPPDYHPGGAKKEPEKLPGVDSLVKKIVGALKEDVKKKVKEPPPAPKKPALKASASPKKKSKQKE